MAGSIRLFEATGIFALDLIQSATGGNDELLITATKGGQQFAGTFRLGTKVSIPPDLIDNGKLKSWSQIQQTIKDLRAQADFAKAAILEAARDALRDALASASLDVNAGAGAFLGIDDLPLQGAARIEARVVIDLLAIDPALAPSDETPVLTAVMAARGTVTVGAATRGAAMRIALVLTRGGLVAALPSLSIDSLPQFPALDFTWPKIAWPELNWPSLDLSALGRLLRLDLPLPKIGPFDSPLRVEWSQAPAFQVSLVNRSLTIATTQLGTGTLKLATSAGTEAELATITGFGLTLAANGVFAVEGAVAPVATQLHRLPRVTIDKPDLLPFTIDIEPPELTFNLSAAFNLAQPANNLKISATLDLPRVLIRAKSDPNLLLALGATYRQDFDAASGATEGRLTRLDVVEPYPVKLVALAARGAADAAQALMRLLASIPVPRPGAPDFDKNMALLDRIADMIAAAARWLARQVGDAADALLGIAEAAGELLANVLKFIRDAFGSLPAAHNPSLVIEVRLDSRSFALRQIMISPAWPAQPPTEPWKAEAIGLRIEVPFDWSPALLVDFDEPASVALLAVPPQQGTKLILGTDLWLARDSGIEAVRETDETGTRPKQRIIEITIGFKQQPKAIAIIRLVKGKVSFLQGLKNAENGAANLALVNLQNPPLKVVQIAEPAVYEDMALDQLDITAQVQQDQITRLLPFLQSSKQNDGNSFLDGLSQYIEVTRKAARVSGSTVELPFGAKLKVAETHAEFELLVTLDLKTFEVRLAGSDKVIIENTQPTKTFNLLGLNGTVTGVPINNPPTKYALFALDFSGKDVRLALAEGAHIDLTYGKVASSGRGIVFRVDQFAMSRGGLDLDARVDPDKPVQLAGVDMPFRFASGTLSIKRSQIQAFSITGAGQLPPELVGEANATITIAMGRNRNGELIVQSAKAELEKADGPIVCDATRFTFTLSAIGLEFHDFSGDGSGYHFYFTLTGSAEFRPKPGEFGDGLLKNLKGVSIKLDKAPLARDVSLLLRAVEFQVAIEPKKTFNVFNLFTFELRGIGFHPSSPAFDGAPAMSISGQVKFVEAGDMISPKFDFHKLWIAPPKRRDKDDKSILDHRPRIRFDGLTVGVRFGNAVSIEGTAIAVDESLPTLTRPGALPKDVTPKGFLASGKLSIKGWAAMSASMGFLELRRSNGELRHAFYLYIQQDELSIEIPTPLGPIYLREVGFGFGFRYTLSAFKAADQVTDIKGLIKVLDDISRYQGDLHNFRAWEPEEQGNRLTLALRGLISIATASEEKSYNAKGEKDLPNPLLFDVVLALRSDLTFFMNARAWLCFNYADWHDSSQHDSWRTCPTLRGYIYLSVPRREFLGRLIADGKGEIGSHPQLPKQLVDAMKGIQWSATTYIRPGLFHQEFGWPYELKFTFSESNFGIACQGGMIQRIEDGAMLYGIAFKAIGYARFGGSVGGRSFGASVTARASFSIAAKFIAYVSVKRFKETLFYGSIAFDVTISLEVRVWLRFKVFSKEIGIEIGFSLSLTISIGLEAAVTPDMLAARGSASVGISAFGRSVRLGIGFAINADGLAAARARVERFLSLGLTVDAPDPERGAAPQAEPPRGPKAVDADRVLDEQVEKRELTKKEGTPPAARGRALQPAGYWAMLFPVAGEIDSYVMTFVPRDHSHTGLGNKLPEEGTPGQRLSTFYPPPFGAAGPQLTPLTFRNVTAPFTLRQLKSNGTHVPLLVQNGTGLSLEDSVVARGDGPDETMRLSRFLAQCFVAVHDTDPVTLADLAEPAGQPIAAGRERLPDSPELAADVLAEAGRDQLNLNVTECWATEIEERRSAAVASFCDSAARLAAAGSSAWTAPAKETLDVRHMGLAFVVTEAELKTLFPATNDGLPRAATFDLSATETTIPALPYRTSVHLFNPPERMFDKRRPRFAEPLVEALASGIRLDWDLEPAFGPSQGVWHDPEYNLKHYRVERTVTRVEELDSLVPARSVTTKAAAPLRLMRNPSSGRFEWRFLRPNAQFVDDLSDLSAGARAAILPNIAEAPDKPNAAEDPVLAELLVQNSKGLELRYVIVPVDTAGIAGTPTYLSLRVHARKKRRPTVKRATLTFEYVAGDPIRDIDATNILEPKVSLGVQDPHVQDPPAGATPPPGPHRYTLRVRREGGAPAGLYGSDAVTDARMRPSASDFALKRFTDTDFELTVKDGLPPDFEDPKLIKEPGAAWRLDPGTPFTQFLDKIGVSVTNRADQGPRGVRFAIRPKVGDGETEPAWTTVDIMMVIRTPKTERPAVATSTENLERPAVATPTEIFEHPVSLQPAPLLADDMTGEAGRVLVLEPPKTGLLKHLVHGTKSPRLTRDPGRRVATRLCWNASPAAPDPVAGKLAASRLGRFIAGFDIAEIDAGAEAEAATNAPAVTALRYRFSATTSAGDPGPGLFRLNKLEQKSANAIFIDTQDFTGTDQSDMLDKFVGGSGTRRGQFRLVSVADTGKWIAFKVTGRKSFTGYRRFDVIWSGASGDNPLAANAEVHLIYTRDAPARSVARVQTLPASLARLDPAEISDFAKVEAHYPSESLRNARAGTARQSAWYSAAESYLVWPKPTLRRSLVINVDDTVVTELLSHGQPDAVLVTLTIPVDKPDAVPGAPVPVDNPPPVVLPPSAVSRHGGAAQPNDGFPLTPGERTAAGLRSLLRELVWDTNLKPLKALSKDATISVTARRGANNLHKVTWPVDLDPALHPVLADVIDWARYAKMPAPGHSMYRRYEPVIEPLPKSAATDVAQWLSETPPQRDPFGWGILRSLGLAVGLRLYDTEKRDYAAPKETLAHLLAAFDAILPRYATLNLGAPFVDLITRAGGTMAIASFDGGTPPVSGVDVKKLMDEDALAMTQIALRPVADRFIAGRARPVAYFAVNADAPTITFDIDALALPGTHAIADIIDLTSGLAKPPTVTLVNNSLRSDPELCKRFTGASDAAWTSKIDVPPSWSNKHPVALVRLTLSTGDAEARPANDQWITGATISPIVKPHATPGLEPFGRFPQMAAQRFAELALVHPAVNDAVAALRDYAMRRFPGGWPKNNDGGLISQLPDWCARFFDHGPATLAAVDPQYAIAEVTRPDPWRIGIAPDGRMEVLFTHEDRKRRLKRYAVKPFGRYDNFVEALRLAKDPDATQTPHHLADPWSDYFVVPQKDEPLEENWGNRFFDVVIPRTEPVAPPVLVDARRIDILPPADNPNRTSRRALEFLYARHPEEILSESNVPIEGALSFEAISVGLWREFPMEGWAQDLVPNIDTTAEFGGWEQPAPPALFRSDDKFGQLAPYKPPGGDKQAGRAPDGWRGILALRTETLPYFYRMHAAAFAAAGVVVSKAVVGTIPEGHYDLNLPWRVALFGQIARAPTWSVTRNQRASVHFHLPLVRFVDGIPEAHRAIWLRADAVPPVFTLPSPDVSYEIRTVAVDATGREAASPEINVVAEQKPAGAATPSGYRIKAVGPLFDAPAPADGLKPKSDAANPRVWWFDATASLKGSDAEVVERFQPLIEPVDVSGVAVDPLLLFEIAGPQFAEWASVAPTTAAVVKLMPPADTVPGWNGFRGEAAQWRALFDPYRAANTGAQTIFDLLADAAANASRAWWQTKGWVAAGGTLQEGPTTITELAAGVPRLADGRPPSIRFEAAANAIWTWPVPQNVGFDARQSIGQLVPSLLSANYTVDQFAAGVRMPIRREMRALLVRRKEAASRYAWQDGGKTFVVAGFTVGIPTNLRAAALRLGRHTQGGVTQLPRAIDVVALVTVSTANATADQLTELIRAAETAEAAVLLVDLGPLEDDPATWMQPGRTLDIHVPCSALPDPGGSPLANILAALGAAPDPSRAVSLLLRMPPDDDDRERLIAAASAALSQDPLARDALLTTAFAAMAEQIFGVGRRPHVKVFHGRTEPQTDAVAPAKFGGS